MKYFPLVYLAGVFLMVVFVATLDMQGPVKKAQAQQQPTVSEKLKARQDDFADKASQQKQDDYDEGIKLVEESGVLETAKNVGDTVPDFTLPNALGQEISLSALLEQGPVVLIWYRGEWCPYCNIYLEDIQAHAGEFEALGAQLVAISPALPDQSWSAQDKEDLRIHVLSDEGNIVAEKFGVAYHLPEKIAEYYQKGFGLHEVNGDESDVLPLAASYVIDQDGKVSYAYLNADYRQRAETSVLLDHVKMLYEK